MSRFEQMSGPTIKISKKDLDTPEKVEKFIALFGRNRYYGAFHDLSEAVYGDGTQQKIENKMARVNLETDEGMEEFGRLKKLRARESNRRPSLSETTIEMPVGSVMDNVFAKREMAKKYLGPVRYYKAAGLQNGMEMVSKKSLRNNNQKINEVESKNDNTQQKIDALEARLKELKNQ